MNGTAKVLGLTGFAVEILDAVARAVGIDYEIKLSASEDDYGSLDRQGRWTGLIREVFLGVSD